MKFIISEVLEDDNDICDYLIRSYIGRTVSVQQWFCEQEKIPTVHEAKLLRISEKAMHFFIAKKAVWIPKRLITITERKERLLGGYC